MLRSTPRTSEGFIRSMSTRSLKVIQSSSSIQAPSYYRSSPPPHHSSTNPIKTGFQFPKEWKDSAKPQTFLGFFKTRLFEWDEELPLPKEEDRPEVKTPTYSLEDEDGNGNGDDRIRFTSIGHAGCHLQIPVPTTFTNPSSSSPSYQTITILTDPVLSKRCSPVQFMGPSRYTKAPTTIAEMAEVEEGEEVKAWPDLVALSHNHYDHLDYDTIYALSHPPTGKPIPHFICTLGVAQFFKDIGVPEENLTELDWWDSKNFQITSTSDFDSSERSSSITVTCVPAQHFSGRGLLDRNKSVFAGYTFKSLPSISTSSTQQEKKEKLANVYFAGDSGYGYIPSGTKKEDEDSLPKCPAFKEIGEVLGPFDLSLIPIGAYSPRSFMSTIHMNPSDAVQVHQLVKSKQSFGIHFNVFRLTPEQIDEPERLLLEEAKKRGLKDGEFTTISIGETRGVEIQ